MTKKLLILNLASLACALGAIAIALCGKDGWGWFLFCALLAHCSPSEAA